MFDDFFEGYDPSYQLFFKASWQTWEEHGWIFIFEKDNQYYYIEGGYSVMSDNDYLPSFRKDLFELNEEQAFEKAKEWEDKEDGCGPGSWID